MLGRVTAQLPGRAWRKNSTSSNASKCSETVSTSALGSRRRADEVVPFSEEAQTNTPPQRQAPSAHARAAPHLQQHPSAPSTTRRGKQPKGGSFLRAFRESVRAVALPRSGAADTGLRKENHGMVVQGVVLGYDDHDCHEGLASEEEVLAQALLDAVYQRRLSEEESCAVLHSCPEVAWLAQCLKDSPLPMGWYRQDSEHGVGYYCSKTQQIAETPPHLSRYADIASALVRFRTDPHAADDVISTVEKSAEQGCAEVEGLKASWLGPHVDPSSGDSYYYCSITGQSSWEHPAAMIEFFVQVVQSVLESELLASARKAVQSARRRNHPSGIGSHAAIREKDNAKPQRSSSTGAVGRRSRADEARNAEMKFAPPSRKSADEPRNAETFGAHMRGSDDAALQPRQAERDDRRRSSSTTRTGVPKDTAAANGGGVARGQAANDRAAAALAEAASKLAAAAAALASAKSCKSTDSEAALKLASAAAALAEANPEAAETLAKTSLSDVAHTTHPAKEDNLQQEAGPTTPSSKPFIRGLLAEETKAQGDDQPRGAAARDVSAVGGDARPQVAESQVPALGSSSANKGIAGVPLRLAPPPSSFAEAASAHGTATATTAAAAAPMP